MKKYVAVLNVAIGQIPIGVTVLHNDFGANVNWENNSGYIIGQFPEALPVQTTMINVSHTQHPFLDTPYFLGKSVTSMGLVSINSYQLGTDGPMVIDAIEGPLLVEITVY